MNGMQTYQITQIRMAALTDTQMCKSHLNTHTHIALTIPHSANHPHPHHPLPHTHRTLHKNLNHHHRQPPPHSASCKACSCACVHISKCLIVKGKNTASTSCSGRWQHGKSCVHISKCGSWYKKNTTSASCRCCPASASEVFVEDKHDQRKLRRVKTCHAVKVPPGLKRQRSVCRIGSALPN